MTTPQSSSPGRLTADQTQYLQVLSIGHYVVAGLAALFGLIPLFYVAFGVIMMVGGAAAEAPLPGALFGGMMIFFGLFFIAAAWVYAFFMVAAGRALVARERHVLCVVMAAISCMFTPFGTVLGIFSLIVLFDDNVKAAFGVTTPTA